MCVDSVINYWETLTDLFCYNIFSIFLSKKVFNKTELQEKWKPSLVLGLYQGYKGQILVSV